LQQAGLRTRIDEPGGTRPNPDALIEYMRHDKKAEGGKLKFVLVRSLGSAFVSTDVPLEAVKAVLAE
jgi:3-dehydroquinate synthase